MSTFEPHVSVLVSVSVRFASEPGVCDTAEGLVRYSKGDAIVTGIRGEQWPVGAVQFSAKYNAAPGTVAGQDGLYVKRRNVVHASRLEAPLNVVLANGRGELKGDAGDWQIRYLDGSESIVGDTYFENLYEPARIPLFFRSDAALEADPDAITHLHELRAALDSALYHTSVHWLRSTDESEAPAWFEVTVNGVKQQGDFGVTLKFPLGVLLGLSRNGKPLASLIERLKQPSNYMHFTLDRIFGLVKLLWALISDEPDDEEDPPRDAEQILPVLAKQLASLDMFNESIHRADMGEKHFVPIPGHYQEPLNALCNAAAPATTDGTLLSRFLAIGAIADHRAAYWQSRWQWRMLAPTKQLSGYVYKMHGDIRVQRWIEPKKMERLRNSPLAFWCRAFLPVSLFTSGLLAAIFFGMFTEFSDGCMEKGNEFFQYWLQCHDTVWHDSAGKLLLGAYLTCMAFAWMVFAHTQIHQLKHRHQDCRMLAESMRVHYAMVAAGLPATTGEHIPISSPASSDWVIQALRILIHLYAAHPPGKPTAQSLQQLQILFVRDQIVYHRVTLVGLRRLALRRFKKLAGAGILIALLALTLLVRDEILRAEAQALPSFAHHLLVIAMVGGLTSWAALRRLADAYGWEAEAQRGAVVLNALRHAEHALQHESSLDSRLNSLQHCGKIFVADQAAWHNLHRARPIEAVSGG